MIATSAPSASASATPPKPAADLVSARPYRLEVPPASSVPAPLVVLLHGYGSSGDGHDSYFGLSKVANARGVIVAIPNGTRDAKGKRFWNATDACCNFGNIDVDDVAYLDAVIDDASRRANVDPARIYMIGHSNGAFMAHRFACERSARVAAIVALAGVPWLDDGRCVGRDVSILQVHGDADRVIEFHGGKSFGNGQPYPSADFAVNGWARRDGCDESRRGAGRLDLVSDIAGDETERQVSSGCTHGTAVELWTLHGAGHVPQFNATFIPRALEFLLAHQKSFETNAGVPRSDGGMRAVAP